MRPLARLRFQATDPPITRIEKAQAPIGAPSTANS